MEDGWNEGIRTDSLFAYWSNGSLISCGSLAHEILSLVFPMGILLVIRSRKILNHARGQPCLLALPGCNCDPESTVFAHLNGGAYGKGMAQKASDIAGMFAGFRCHSRYDLHQTGLSDAELNAALLKAVIATWEILIRDGIIVVPMDAPKEHKPAVRKPKDQRKAIPGPKDHKWPSRPMGKRKEGK